MCLEPIFLMRCVVLLAQEGREPERYLSWADAFIVVYSVTSSASFGTAQKYLEALSGPSGPSFESPLLLVGTQADLESHRYAIQIYHLICEL